MTHTLTLKYNVGSSVILWSFTKPQMNRKDLSLLGKLEKISCRWWPSNWRTKSRCDLLLIPKCQSELTVRHSVASTHSPHAEPIRYRELQRPTCSSPVFPAPFIEEAVVGPLYILASFIKNKLFIGTCTYFWAFYHVPLVYISVFVPVPYCLDDRNFVV